jgi:hypothetical protein
MVGEKAPIQGNQNPTLFDGKKEHRNRPKPITTSVTLRSVVENKKWLGARNIGGSKGDPSKLSGIKRRSALYDLPYFEVCIA